MCSKRKRRLSCFLFLIVFFLMPYKSFGWETNVYKPYKHSWLSIYNARGKSVEKEAIDKDEHTAFSDLALRELGVSEYTYNRNPIIITDINASYLKSENLFLKKGTFPPQQAPTVLEKRQLPAPTQFSGLPDFSYTLYDWINKNTLCPPDSLLDYCHEYYGWLGALNSYHFGTQAKKTYWHLHQLALNIAKHARDLREKIKKNEETFHAYREYVREAEREALSVEGYAQHFLQDRWSTGHMWERWGAPDYKSLPDKSPSSSLFVAAFAGMLHGSEAVTGMPDPLSSPYVSWTETATNNPVRTSISKAINWVKSFFVEVKKESPDYGRTKGGYFIPLWKHDKGSPGVSYGIGDDRLLDMLDKAFGKEYKSIGRDYALNVSMQKYQMFQCMMAGWAEVIRAFGKNDEGGYGIEKVRPREDIVGFRSLGFSCDDQWVTNASVAIGWFDNLRWTSQAFGQLARAVVVLKSEGIKPIKILGSYKQRKDLLKITLRIRTLGMLNKNSKKETTLAKGMISSFGPFKTGNHYGLPDYIEPVDINSLPDRSDTGRDKETWYGFFNRSHADYWCNHAEIFFTLRGGSDTEKKVCKYMADRFYVGTPPDYKGIQAENRDLHYPPAFCQTVGIKGTRSPFYILPGYVEKPYKRSTDNMTFASIEAWCDKVPILYLMEDQADRQRDIVAKIKDPGEVFKVRGENLGYEPGKVWLGCRGSNREVLLDIISWNDNAIKLRLPRDREFKSGFYKLCLSRKDGKESVGRFIVEIIKTGEIIKGKVLSENNELLSGAVVTLELDGREYKGYSSEEGAYRIEIPEDISLPDRLIIRADKEGYNTATRDIGKEEFWKADIKLSRISKDVIQIDPSLHHLGNSNYEGAINSRFQRPKAEGSRYKKSFKIPQERLSGIMQWSVKLKAIVRGAEEDNPVIINGKKVGALNNSNPDGSATNVEIPVDPCILRSGENTLEILAKDTNANGDIDDFEFANIQLVFKPLNKQDFDKRIAELVSIRVTDNSFKADLKEVSRKGKFSIEARGKGQCETLREMAFAEVFPKGRGESSAIRIRLVETGPGTSLFRSESPVSVAKLDVGDSDKIIVRAGIRGTSVMVKGEEEREKAQPLYKERSTERTSKGNVKKNTPSVAGERHEKAADKRKLKKDEKRSYADKEPSGPKRRRAAEPEAMPLSGGGRKLKAGIPIKQGPPTKEERCRRLLALKERIDSGEKPRLFERYYEVPNGEPFRMIEDSEEPELKSSGYRESIVRNFIVFSKARKSLERLIKEIGCK